VFPLASLFKNSSILKLIQTLKKVDSMVVNVLVLFLFFFSLLLFPLLWWRICMRLVNAELPFSSLL
jgi:hypothetical protein